MWTSERPNNNGYYWARWKQDDDDSMFIIHIQFQNDTIGWIDFFGAEEGIRVYQGEGMVYSGSNSLEFWTERITFKGSDDDS